ncbi:MAG TPA: T9SS type A sorting domain-containing protein [Bacteroidales bacterium]|nr:T9SS type A sorting domain-containing protein [Bacteroidales bacterium]HPS17746.1 T9SS type A sorting domain-containing protein [Bacteroidales bacterium]
MKKIKSFFTLLLFLFANCLFAQPGALDSDWDADGKITTDFNTTYDFLYSLAVQSDGKVIAAGYLNAATSDFAVARYNTDGTLDNTFSVDGKVTTAIGTDDDQAFSVALQDDGKIVLCGASFNSSDYDFAVVRYNADGTLDNTFDSNGSTTTAIGTGNDIAQSLAIQPDGKIVAAGFSMSTSGWDFAVVRYNSDGSLDTDFSTDGKVTTAIGTTDDRGYAVAIQPDGKIVVAGLSYNGSDMDFALVRYNSDGTLDINFGTNGKVTTAIGTGEDVALSMALQSDGKIVLAGYSYNGSTPDIALARYNSDGTLDTGFSSDGKVTTDIASEEDRAYSVKIQADNKILVGGLTSISSNYDFALVRYNSDGTLDTDFSSDGKVTTAIGPSLDYAYAMTIQPNGRILLGGISTNGSNYDFAITRYLSGLNIGVVEFSKSEKNILVYPNPIQQNSVLEYTLDKNENISIRMVDMQGKTVKTFIDNEKQNAGDHKQNIFIPQEIPAGSYFIVISSESGQEKIKIIK